MLRSSTCDEKRSKSAHRDDDYGDGGFGVFPEYNPCGVDLAMAEVPTGDSYNCSNNGEDAQAEDSPKSEFSTKGDLDIPQQEDWD